MTRTKADGTKEQLTTRYDYDLSNRLVKTTYRERSFIQISYNAIGKLDTTTDARGKVTHYAG